MKIVLKNVRLSFAHIFTPQVDAETGKAAYSTNLILPPEHPQLAKVNEAIIQVAKEKWNDKAASVLKALKIKDAICLHNGDTKAKYDGFEGNFFISARSPTRPLVIDRDRTPLTEKDGRPYSGCFVNASIDIWSQDSKFGQRINAGLAGVQFYKDGPAFSGAAIATPDDFEEFGDDEEGLDFL